MPLHQIGSAEVVSDSMISRRQVGCLTEHHFRVFVFCPPKIEESCPVISRPIVRAERNSSLKRGLRLRVVVQLVVRITKCEDSQHLIRIERNGLIDLGQRLVVLAACTIDISKTGMSL